MAGGRPGRTSAARPTTALLELALGYNGLGRIFGGSGNGGGGAVAAAARQHRVRRRRRASPGCSPARWAPEISWLLPAALIALVAGLWVSRRAPRTDRPRAALLLWGGWLLVTGLVFSYMSGTIHPYYTVALAPAIAALVGIGTVALWRRRGSVVARGVSALAVAATAAWGFALLAGSGEVFAWVRWIVLAAGVVAVAGLAAGSIRRDAVAGVAAAALVGLAGTGAYAVATAATAHGGSIPTAGTSASAMGGGPGGGAGAMGRPGGTPPWMSGATSGTAADATAGQGGGPAGGGGMGGATSTELTALLTTTTSTWSAAVSSSQSAASLELASGTAVMSTGGWSGSDSAVTLAQFQADVAQGKIHYYIGGGQGGGPGGGSDSTSAQIAAWVQENFSSTTVGNQRVYDLTQ